MTNSRNNIDRNETDFDESDDLLMSEDVEFFEEDMEEVQSEQRSKPSRGFNMDMRHRIEDRMEEKRLQKELNEYEFFDIDDEDTVH